MRLKRIIGIVLTALMLLAVPGCMKMEFDSLEASGDGYQSGGSLQVAVATLRMQEGLHYLQLTDSEAVYIFNQSDLAAYGDALRVLVQYVEVGGFTPPAMFGRVVYIEWMEPLEEGMLEAVPADDPVDIVTDWVTSVEDGILTIHYQVLTTGKVQHRFSIGRGNAPYEILLRHDADGDTGGILSEGIVWFPLSGLLPDTEGGTVELTLRYQALDGQEKKLTFDYRTRR